MNTYENFQYVPGTKKRLATVDLVGSFLWFKWKKTIVLMRLVGEPCWRYVSNGGYTEGLIIESLEVKHNATAAS